MTAVRFVLGAAGIALGVLAYHVQIDNLGSADLDHAGAGDRRRRLGVPRRRADRVGAAAGEPPRAAPDRGRLRAPGPPVPLQPRPARVHGLLRPQRALVRARRPLGARLPLGTRPRARGARARQGRVRVGAAPPARDPALLRRDRAAPVHGSDGRTRACSRLGEREPRLALQKIFVIWVWGVLATIFIALVVRRLVRATPRARRLLAPLFLAAVVFALRAVYEGIFTFVDRPSAVVDDVLFWWQIAGFIAPADRARRRDAAGAARAGERRRAGARAGADPPEGMRDALARALGDPALESGSGCRSGGST